jgi:hypothetical protein
MNDQPSRDRHQEKPTQRDRIRQVELDPTHHRSETITLLRKLAYAGIYHHAIPSFPCKRESRAVSAPLALGARFRGHDENIGISYVNFRNKVLAQTWWARTLKPPYRIAAAEIEVDLGEAGPQLIRASDRA